LVKKIIIVKNATAYTWDWFCHLVVDRASLRPWSIVEKGLYLLTKSQEGSELSLDMYRSLNHDVDSVECIYKNAGKHDKSQCRE
jgi:hypothetical protein